MSILSFLFGNSSKNNNIEVLSPSDFKSHINKKSIQLIDVRTPGEYQSGHIKGAKNIDIFSPSFTSQIENLNKEKPVYVYCRSGARSSRASKKLNKLGFTAIYDLSGGYLNWR
ncbi:rhodanese-like domain-containing protein [Gaetbulibacter saemankumensis]|uniref:rhodanese-like domain-containing protein n=1 Tax=Gaetbulibacter saemankumensis TaxID=311208 RepID=UPI000427FA59|nr:rhodanese-like domain-containing protein [Gaetbulibacter saemankumensis]